MPNQTLILNKALCLDVVEIPQCKAKLRELLSALDSPAPTLSQQKLISAAFVTLRSRFCLLNEDPINTYEKPELSPTDQIFTFVVTERPIIDVDEEKGQIKVIPYSFFVADRLVVSVVDLLHRVLDVFALMLNRILQICKCHLSAIRVSTRIAQKYLSDLGVDPTDDLMIKSLQSLGALNLYHRKLHGPISDIPSFDITHQMKVISDSTTISEETKIIGEGICNIRDALAHQANLGFSKSTTLKPNQKNFKKQHVDLLFNSVIKYIEEVIDRTNIDDPQLKQQLQGLHYDHAMFNSGYTTTMIRLNNLRVLVSNNVDTQLQSKVREKGIHELKQIAQFLLGRFEPAPLLQELISRWGITISIENNPK